MSNYKIVLLGATGFVGSSILRQINKKITGEYEVNALVRGDQSRISHPFVNVFKGELQEIPEKLFPDEPHVVLYFAAKQIDNDGKGFYNTNVLGTRNILDIMPPSTKGIIFGSSMSVYGQGEQLGVTEESTLKPETDLAKSRVMAEEMILSEMKKKGRSAYTLRPRFIIGEGDNFVLPALIKMVMNNQVIGSGKQLFSIIDVDHYAEIILSLATKILNKEDAAPSVCKPFNIGYRKPIALNDMINKICLELKIDKPQKKIPISKKLLKLSHVIPNKKIHSLVTKMELIGLSHYCSVDNLSFEVGENIIGLKSNAIFNNILKKYKQ